MDKIIVTVQKAELTVYLQFVILVHYYTCINNKMEVYYNKSDRKAYLGGAAMANGNDSVFTENGQEIRSRGTAQFPCAVYRWNPKMTYIRWHWHEEYEFSVIKKGPMTVCAGQQSFVLETGDGLFINSGTIHHIPFQEVDDCDKMDIVFHGKVVYGSYDSALWQKYMRPMTACAGLETVALHRNIPWERQVLDLLERAGASCESCEDGYEFDVKEDLLQVFKLLYKNGLPVRSGEADDSSRDTDRVKEMLNFIHSHYREGIHLADIAASASICERECLRCFKELIRLSPIQYLIHYRIENACRMIKELHCNITEICEACGFESPSYFSKTFKRIVGCTPREYRS